MANPCPGRRVTTGYDRKGSWARGYHGAYDYAAPHGAKVVAAAGGRVTHVGWGGFGRAYGAHIVVETNGIRHLYAHLSRTRVKVGQNVATGHHIGSVGTTGNSTGPHLHYEERVRPWGYRNNRRPKFPSQGGGSSGGGGTPKTYLSKLKYGQRNSDSVKNLQRALNAHKMRGGSNLPVTGYYGPKTDQEVRLCQRLHGLGKDAARRSNVGPKQAAHLGLPGVRR